MKTFKIVFYSNPQDCRWQLLFTFQRKSIRFREEVIGRDPNHYPQNATLPREPVEPQPRPPPVTAESVEV